jgi:hypothetical protein
MFSWKVLCLVTLVATLSTSQLAAREIGYEGYIGLPADTFFINNGPAYASQKLSDGSTLYAWSTGVHTVTTPGSASTIGNITTYRPSTSVQLECRLKIIADTKGIVTSIEILSDTMGVWNFSRCKEYF